jgi:small neutral amino acid transporter SnatA (MarC family)
MSFDTIDIYLIADIFLLLLIGMGPKIALVPFLQKTQDMEPETRKKVADRMVLTAVVTAFLLVLFGSLLMRLLHFSPGAADVAGGIVLLMLALRMLELLGRPAEMDGILEEPAPDPMHLATYPLAVPYLLNPVGIASLVVMSSDMNSLLSVVIVATIILLVGALDYAIFHNIDKLTTQLSEARLAVTEAVFGVLLAALAVQLMVDGLTQMGVLSLNGGH